MSARATCSKLTSTERPIHLSPHRDALPTVIPRTAAQLFPHYGMKLEDNLSLRYACSRTSEVRQLKDIHCGNGRIQYASVVSGNPSLPIAPRSDPAVTQKKTLRRLWDACSSCKLRKWKVCDCAPSLPSTASLFFVYKS
jgi:hypothetical protein